MNAVQGRVAPLRERRSRMRIGDILVSQGVATPEQIQAALDEQKNRKGVRFGQLLVELGFVDDHAIARALASHLHLPCERLDQYLIDREAVKLVPADLANRYKVIPLFKIKQRLSLAMADPLDVFAMDAVRTETGLQLDVVVAAESEISEILQRMYGASMDSVLTEIAGDIEIDKEEERVDVIDVNTIASAAEEAPIIKLFNSVLGQALNERASDIHIEPEENRMRIRYRIDGMLRERKAPPLSCHAPLVSRLKLLANLDIAERRIPQDGRVRIRASGRVVDLRISILPTVFGEKAVMRVLDTQAQKTNLADLGLDEHDSAKILAILQSPNGIVLATGPTGSGKTTTLYACLQKLNQENVNIITVEDPVEYHFFGVNQVQVVPKAGLGFAEALRSILRQDPDIIMIGEIRDQSTVEIAVQAALTGHFVLSTLHTNDATLTITRLVQMGIPPYLVGSALTAVISQRLARRLCVHCRQEDELSPDLAGKWEVSRGAKIWRERGCIECGGRGYSGRVGLFEILHVTEEIREAITVGASARTIREMGRVLGMRTLQQAGVEKILHGETSVAEVLRVTQDYL